MTPQRVAVKLFMSPDPAAPVALPPLIPLFHRFIQQASVEGLLIDVADYAHVPEGPGIMLVGHDVEYALDLGQGRAGLLTTRKRIGDLPLAEAVSDALRMGLVAAKAIAEDGSTDLRFAVDGLEVRFIDRLATPNDDAAVESVHGELAPLLEKLFDGAGAELARAADSDPRSPLTFRVSLREAPSAETLIERLGGQRASTLPGDSEWDISAEDLKKLRDEGAEFRLIDVREPHEYEICHLGGELIPLDTLPAKLDELDRSAHIVTHCKVGPRGARAANLLREAGFENAWNLQGGIFAWIDRIDPSLPKY